MSESHLRVRWWLAVLTLGLVAATAALLLGDDAAAFSRAARSEIRRLEAIAGRAQGFDGDEALAKIAASSPYSGALRLDAELDSAVLETLGPASAPPACEVLELTADSSPGLVAVGEPGPPTRQGGLRLGAADYLMASAGFVLDRDRLGLVELRLRSHGVHRIWLAWSAEELSTYPQEGGSIERTAVDLMADGQSRTYRLDLRRMLGHARLDRPSTTVESLFLLPPEGPGEVEVESLRFVPRRCSYLAGERGFGTAYETLGTEMRYALFTVAPSRLAFRLRVPRQAPRLEVGLGILEARRSPTLRVGVVDRGQRSVLLDEEVAAEGWSDRVLDLTPWAGREIELELETIGSAGTVTLWSSPTARGPAARPARVLLILEDTLRADHLSLHGHRRETSPALDALAARGATFERAYSTATKTRPSVPSLMTSLYPSASGVVTHYDRLAEPYVTLAEILRAAGFATAAFIQNGNAGPAAGLHQGFDRSATRATPEDTLYDHPDVLRWLEQHREQSFFLYLHLLDPHGPYDPGPPFDRWYRESGPGTTAVARHVYDPEWVRRPTREGRRLLYDGEIRRNDEGLARLLERLAGWGIDDALLVFLSDHGEHLGEHGLWWHHPPSYAQVVHVPLVIVAPGRVSPGLRLSDPVSLIDVAPTVVDLLGLDGSALLQQGRSLRPRLEGAARDRRRIVLVEEATVYRGPSDLSVSAIFDPFHVLFSHLRSAPEIYDVEADPRQESPLPPNLARRRLLPKVGDYARRLGAINRSLRSALAGEAPDVLPQDPEVQEQLRALGYL